jgi:hypothetical protein
MGIDLLGGRCRQPDITAPDFTGIGIEEHLLRIKEMARLGIRGSLHSEAILEFLVVQIVDDHGIDIAYLALGRKRYLGKGLRLALPEEHQCATGGMGGKNGKVYPTRHVARPVGKGVTIPHPEPSIFMGVVESRAHGTQRIME